jgi:hypothetical protein
MDQQSIEYRDFLAFFWIEHFGLFLLIGSGVLMLIMYGNVALEWGWLKLKISLVLCVIIPIEILDVWFGHVCLPRFYSSESRINEVAGKSIEPITRTPRDFRTW